MSTQTEEFEIIQGPIPLDASVCSVLGYNPAGVPDEFKKIAVANPDALACHSLATRELLNVNAAKPDDSTEHKIRYLYRRAAVGGLDASLYWLGISLNYTEGGDPNKAQQLFERAAHAGHGPAEFERFCHYDRQARREEGNPQALYWLERASGHRYPEALHSLAARCDSHRYGQDRERATALFLDAAEQGHPPSQMRVSRRFEHGYGTKIDLRAAAYWRLEAARQGDDEAITYLADIRNAFAASGATDPKALKLIEDIGEILARPEIAVHVAAREQALSAAGQVRVPAHV